MASGIVITSIVFLLVLFLIVIPVVNRDFESTKLNEYNNGLREGRRQAEQDLLNAYLTASKLRHDIEVEKDINNKLLEYIKENGAEPKRTAAENNTDLYLSDNFKYFTKITIPQFAVMARTAFSDREEIEKEINEIREKAGINN